jgi:filamentous hemagglutinin family protein
MFNKKGVFPLGLSLLFVLTTGWSSQCKASPKEDGTTSTQVQTENQSYRIVGGTQAGANLLHSFSQFSVETGWSAIFELPEGTDIANVISRVTGANVSNIDGTLKINNSVSVVNLFLINPNGIVFGKNAQLDLRGSFIASTAQSLKFSDGYILQKTLYLLPLI